ncbi:MAG: hypothetical protein WC908_02885 [Candidatus Paceibacterota bacterium]
MKNKIKIQRNKGAAMMIVVLFFMFISLTILIGIVTPVVREFRIAGDNFNSKQAYFIAESGVEDVMYRLKNNMEVGTIGESRTLFLDDSFFPIPTEFTDIFGGRKQIVTTGDINSNQRKVNLILTTTTGVSFNYGVQVGIGGFNFTGNAKVIGNVYSNGNITGENNAAITGTAISTGTISGMTIGTGTTGNAKAHTVNNSTIRGINYCQTGTGNNKACDTSQPDPIATIMPISDQNILDWKEEASVGDPHVGNYLLDSNNTASLGPKEITGNFTIDGNAILTITGTIWVHGNITINNNAIVKLSNSYGVNSGVIVADGNVNFTGNNRFEGSGQTGSYILLVTTSTCPVGPSCGGDSTNAITIGNNANAVILNAQQGTISFLNNAQVNEATAKTIVAENNTIITYLEGLADVNFSSGPSGSWGIDSWQESE